MPKIMPKAQLEDHIFLAQFKPPHPPTPPSPLSPYSPLPPPYFYHQQGNFILKFGTQHLCITFSNFLATQGS